LGREVTGVKLLNTSIKGRKLISDLTHKGGALERIKKKGQKTGKKHDRSRDYGNSRKKGPREVNLP